MPVFRLSSPIVFPPAVFARADGLLCIGGDLSPERLIAAYQSGIFPWYSEGEPILWWSPDPRLVLFPKNIRITRRLKKKIRQGRFPVTFNTDFKQTISACAALREQKFEGTWLVDEMIRAYIRLHDLGYAHSVEVWRDGELVGGLYGICLGKSFFGESMFSKVTDTSKIALAALCEHLGANGFDMIDCQVTSNHLLSMGAVEISRTAFLTLLEASLKKQTPGGMWNGFAYNNRSDRINADETV